jgi:RNA binding exosome subunit
LPIKKLELRVYVHATESREKVLSAIKNIIPVEYMEKAKIVEEEYEGHYGNPIHVITVTIEGVPDSEKLLRHIVDKLSKADRTVVASSLEERVDRNGTLYLRLSKQDAFLGNLIIYDSDDVVRIAVGYSGKRRKAIEDYRRIFTHEESDSEDNAS